MLNFKQMQENILNFMSDYLENSGAKGFCVGLSGGLDSAVVLSLCAKIAPTSALLMPTNASQERHFNDALALAKSLKVEYKILNIQSILDSFLQKCSIDDLSTNCAKLRAGNISARIRMVLLYDYSALNSLLVVGTSNKSEQMLGYGTIYGDMACALNPLAHIFKSDLFDFARFLGLSQNIINKAPSADLWINQSDEGEMGFNYTELDAVLKGICAGLDEKDLIKNYGAELSEFVLKRVKNNAFKLKMPAILE